jgi:hypothetical protein
MNKCRRNQDAGAEVLAEEDDVPLSSSGRVVSG